MGIFTEEELARARGERPAKPKKNNKPKKKGRYKKKEWEPRPIHPGRHGSNYDA